MGLQCTVCRRVNQLEAEWRRIVHPRLKRVLDPETEYTCPMHPVIRQNGPGSCPFCGMA